MLLMELLLVLMVSGYLCWLPWQMPLRQLTIVECKIARGPYLVQDMDSTHQNRIFQQKRQD